ncbi:hypothetical protein TorRG33x02_183340, partial [Trema orientale]
MEVLTLLNVLRESFSDASQDFFEYEDLDNDSDDLANVRNNILKTVADIYINRKTELNEHFRLVE